ncbi:MAG: hypothetical protein RBT43_07575, partial [bacterium]|nr:hypothetical protein [bacterium]
MKRLLLFILLLICVPLFVFSQEEYSNEPETYFQELIKTLNPNAQKDSAKAEENIEKKVPPLPAPDPVPAEEVSKEAEIPDETPLQIPVQHETSPSPSLPPASPLPLSPIIQDTPPAGETVTDDKSTAALPVPDNEIVIGDKKAKKEKPEKVKKEREPREPREYVPFIEPAVAKNKSQGKYVKKLEKAPERRMRLIT